MCAAGKVNNNRHDDGREEEGCHTHVFTTGGGSIRMEIRVAISTIDHLAMGRVCRCD